MRVNRSGVIGVCAFICGLALGADVVCAQVETEDVSLGSFAALLDMQPGDEPLATAVEAIPPFASEGSWRWSVYGGGAVDPEEESERFNLHWTAEHFLVDDFSVSFELGGLVFTNSAADDKTAYGGNFNILFRWYLPEQTDQSWRLYLDAGAGLLYASEAVPAGGKEFNFTPQAGVGASFDIGNEGARWMLGVRWHHVSNARFEGQLSNPGSDAIMGYVGMSFPWGS